jgi:hypothetical protein
MGLSLVDSHNGPLNLVIPPTHVVTTRWLVQVATELEHAVGNRPHVELKEEGICLEVPRGAFTQRSRLMHLELPNLVEPTSEVLESPRVLYYSKPDRAGVLCADQPTSGQKLRELRGSRTLSSGQKLTGSVELELPRDLPAPSEGRLMWRLVDTDFGLLSQDEITAFYKPALAGTCSLEVWSLDITVSTIRIVLEGPVWYKFNLSVGEQIPGLRTIRKDDNGNLEVIAHCTWDRDLIWFLCERLAWMQGLFPVAPMVWRYSQDTRILLDRPPRRSDWPLTGLLTQG